MHRDGWSSKADRRSVLAYNGEFFPITNAPCLRCIVENASPFSIVFSQLETEWLTISISFVPFFLPLRLVSFVSFFFFSLYSWKILFYFLQNRWRYPGIMARISGCADRSGIWNSIVRINQWFSLKSRVVSILIDAD